MEVFHALTVDDVSKVVAHVVARISASTGRADIALSGDLGAGKTTFVQLLAKAFGVKDVVTSPTFVVMKQYATEGCRFATLVHVDAYRIDDEAELNVLRFGEVCNDPTTLVIVEWPERVPRHTTMFPIRIACRVDERGGRLYSIETT